MRVNRIDERHALLATIMDDQGNLDVNKLAANDALVNKLGTESIAAALAIQGDNNDSDDSEGEEDGEDHLIVLGNLPEESKHKIDEGEGDDHKTRIAMKQNSEEHKDVSEESNFDDTVMRKKTMIKGNFLS